MGRLWTQQCCKRTILATFYYLPKIHHSCTYLWWQWSIHHHIIWFMKENPWMCQGSAVQNHGQPKDICRGNVMPWHHIMGNGLCRWDMCFWAYGCIWSCAMPQRPKDGREQMGLPYKTWTYGQNPKIQGQNCGPRFHISQRDQLWQNLCTCHKIVLNLCHTCNCHWTQPGSPPNGCQVSIP